jgi:hypothetical protein
MLTLETPLASVTRRPATTPSAIADALRPVRRHVYVPDAPAQVTVLPAVTALPAALAETEAMLAEG